MLKSHRTAVLLTSDRTRVERSVPAPSVYIHFLNAILNISLVSVFIVADANILLQSILHCIR
jgi:hypothetical protein